MAERAKKLTVRGEKAVGRKTGSEKDGKRENREEGGGEGRVG